MSKKNKRTSMLAALNNTLRDIEADAENQTPEILAGNMKLLQAHVKDILAIDGVGMFNPDAKVGE